MDKKHYFVMEILFVLDDVNYQRYRKKGSSEMETMAVFTLATKIRLKIATKIRKKVSKINYKKLMKLWMGHLKQYYKSFNNLM